MPNYSKLDHWSLRAQKEGYPARSVYKLKEMDEKFGFIKVSAGRSPFRILDLGSAPGSWSLYIMKKFMQGRQRQQSDFLLVSVDFGTLSREYDNGLFDLGQFLFIQGDFTHASVREAILSHGPYNLILSDAAPATSGNRSLDTLRSLALAETALDYAENALAQGGNLAIKVFQGGETGDFLKTLRGCFSTTKSYKPQACRAESFETYFLGLDRKI